MGISVASAVFPFRRCDLDEEHAAPKIYYNLTITGLSIAVALTDGSIELVSFAHGRPGLNDPPGGLPAHDSTRSCS